MSIKKYLNTVLSINEIADLHIVPYSVQSIRPVLARSEFNKYRVGRKFAFIEGFIEEFKSQFELKRTYSKKKYLAKQNTEKQSNLSK